MVNIDQYVCQEHDQKYIENDAFTIYLIELLLNHILLLLLSLLDSFLPVRIIFAGIGSLLEYLVSLDELARPGPLHQQLAASLAEPALDVELVVRGCSRGQGGRRGSRASDFSGFALFRLETCVDWVTGCEVAWCNFYFLRIHLIL